VDRVTEPASIMVQRRIEWADTDASGYHHNTATFRLIEVAETALFARLGILDELYGRLPRAHIEADFRRALRHRDLLNVHLRVERIGRRSIAYGVRMEHEGEVAVEANVVAVLLDASRTPEPWPRDARERLLTWGPQPPELLVDG
jgi:acyl-CoA thioester hydrolase